MSSSVDQPEVEEVCASCGITGGDSIKLMICTACKLVKYCSVDCQKNHRKQHKKECKKRAAELRDNRLFTQPEESHYGECPLCCLPLPLDRKKLTINSCCCQTICKGCAYANQLREFKEGCQHAKCPFCRELLPDADEEHEKNNYMERAKANDPAALFTMGTKCNEEGDYEGALEYYTKAAGLGSMDAHYNLSYIYNEGRGVEKDPKKELYHLEEASIGGHPSARYNLGYYEGKKGGLGGGRNEMHDRAAKHYIIAARLGHDEALNKVKQGFVAGLVSKEDYASTLRGHQAAVDATKSTQREEADAFYKKIEARLNNEN